VELPENEVQSRTLSRFGREDQPPVWEKAYRDAGGQPTASQVMAAARALGLLPDRSPEGRKPKGSGREDRPDRQTTAWPSVGDDGHRPLGGDAEVPEDGVVSEVGLPEPRRPAGDAPGRPDVAPDATAPSPPDRRAGDGLAVERWLKSLAVWPDLDDTTELQRLALLRRDLDAQLQELEVWCQARGIGTFHIQFDDPEVQELHRAADPADWRRCDACTDGRRQDKTRRCKKCNGRRFLIEP
jgi:hypothetical protein